MEAFLDSYQDKSSLVSDDDIQTSKKAIWNTIVSQIEPQTNKKKQFPFASYLVYAAAASLILFLAINVFFNSDKNDGNTPILVQQPIQIGTDKATLTLEDGSDIPLEKGKTFITKNIDSNGEALVYHTNDQAKISETIIYNYLTIPRGGQFYVTLSDGTNVWLNSETKLKYPVTFKKGEPRNVELVYGEAYFDVSPSTNHNGDTFKVNFNEQHIEVLGTEFNVKAYQDETSTYTTLVEGKIALNLDAQEKMLQPNQQAQVNQNSKNIIIKTVDVYNETSWKEGVFSFKGKTLEDIAKVLARWYDVEFVFEKEDLKLATFRGVLGKEQPIEDILSSIKNASFITAYEIKNKIIYIK